MPSPAITPRSSTRSPDSLSALARPVGSLQRARPLTRCSTGSGTRVNGGLYTTAEDAEELIVRQKDLKDNALPSANSTAAVALYRLAGLTGEQRYANQADRILHLLNTQVDQGIGMYSNALIARRPSPPRDDRGSSSSATVPTSCAWHSRSGVPTRCWPGASRTTHHCGKAATKATPTSVVTMSVSYHRTPSKASPKFSQANVSRCLAARHRLRMDTALRASESGASLSATGTRRSTSVTSRCGG